MAIFVGSSTDRRVAWLRRDIEKEERRKYRLRCSKIVQLHSSQQDHFLIPPGGIFSRNLWLLAHYMFTRP
jgi:hypothetical protein